MKKQVITKLLILLTLILGIKPLVRSQDGYPIPPEKENMLFYFQRSHNKNTVVYELNKSPNGKMVKNKPIKIYWIRYEEGSVIKELSFFQERAFGLKWKITDEENESFILHFNRFKDRDIFLLRTDKSSEHKALITINGELSELNRMYMKSENNSLGIPLVVNFVEISGISLTSGKLLTERITP